MRLFQLDLSYKMLGRHTGMHLQSQILEAEANETIQV